MWIIPTLLVDGHIVATGDSSLVDKINEEGYESFIQAAGKTEGAN